MTRCHVSSPSHLAKRDVFLQEKADNPPNSALPVRQVILPKRPIASEHGTYIPARPSAAVQLDLKRQRAPDCASDFYAAQSRYSCILYSTTLWYFSAIFTSDLFDKSAINQHNLTSCLTLWNCSGEAQLNASLTALDKTNQYVYRLMGWKGTAQSPA